MRVASISTDVRCHEWPEGKLQHSYATATPSGTPIKSISWAKDCGWLVLVPPIGPTEIVSFNDSSKLLHTIHEVAYPTCACFQNSTKRNIAIGTESGQLLVYDIKMKAVKKSFPSGPAAFFKVQYAHKDNHVVVGCQNGDVYVYSNSNMNVSGRLKVPKSQTLTNFRCHIHKKNLIGGCSEEGIVTLWDINKSKSLLYTEAHRAPVTDISFSMISPELIATVGMDRRLCIYDTASNKLITDKNLGQTPTAIDICPDGIGIAIGFQDGNVVAYDSRHMKECVYKFSAHNTKVNQLIFDKISEEKASSISLPEEVNEYVVCEADIKNSNHSSGYLCSEEILAGIPKVEKEIATQETLPDSFMDAIGLNSASVSSLKPNSSVLGLAEDIKKSMDSIPNILIEDDEYRNSSPRTDSNHSYANIKPRRSHVDNFVAKNLISTPLGQSGQDTPLSYISPILSQNRNTYSIPEVDLKRVFKEVVKEELEEFKNEIRYQMLDVMGMMRRHFLDLQMSIVKEFIKVEDNMGRFREDVFSVDGNLAANESFRYLLETVSKQQSDANKQ